MTDLGQFFDMGGYAGFIWPSYAICFGLLIVLAVQSVTALQRRRRELEMLERSRTGRASGEQG